LTNEPVPGIEWEYNLVKNNIDKITLDEVNKIKEEIGIDKTYFALVTTKTADKLPTDAELKSYVDNSLKAEVSAYAEKELPKKLLTQEPTPGKIVKEEKDPKIKTTTWTLSNGAKVTYKTTAFKNDEIMFSGYRFGGSSLYEGKDYQSADYCNNVVDEMGYGAFSNTDLQKFMTGKIANVSTVMDLNNEIVSGRSSNKDFEMAMQLLYLKCTAPRVDETAFASYKNRQMQMIAQMKSDPQSFFGDTLNNFMYRNNPRMKQIPTQSDFDAINLNNAIKYYTNRFSSANGMNYFFVGSIDEASFKPLIEKYIGGLGAQAIPNKSKDLGIELVKGDNKFTIKVGDEPKSMVNEMAYFDAPYSQQDELELFLLTEVINNRITDIIREKMSAIYGGGAGLRLTKFPKERFMMQSYLPCGPENAAKVQSAFWEIIAECKKPGNIKADELSKATETAIQKYKVNIETNGFWLGTLSKYQQYALPTENVTNYEARVMAVTPERLSQLANKYLGNPNANILHALMMPASSR
jgi:zinc protease